MRTAEIRRRYLEYFEKRDHTVVPSASLISDDPSLLFTVAGMVPFIPYMLGEVASPWKRAVSVQKCLRTGDIDEVGKTTRHGTFFQMNGNFSFGDYFKRGAIEYAWELVTGSQEDGCYGFDPNKVWVTVYHDDDEAAQLWHDVAGLPAQRIQRRGLKDNYWSTGQPGPGGPCSEIYIDRGPAYGPDGGPVVDEDRFLEIWNLVFQQHEIADVKSKEDFRIVGDLAQQNIDTGMGLERVAYLLQGVENLYEIDEVFGVIAKVQELSGRRYHANHDDDVRMRVVADHLRSGVMLIADGVTPANEGRGYVLRRLLRRSVRAMRLLGVPDHTFGELLPVVRDAMSESYPVLGEQWERIATTAIAEEDAFGRTLESGTAILDVAVTKAKAAGETVLSGAEAFTLHDTYGFPIDLTLEMAAEHGLEVDETQFRALMTQQRERARADAKAKKIGHADAGFYGQLLASIGGEPVFVGYTDSAAHGKVLAVLSNGVEHPALSGPAEVEVVLDTTPFYAESGGQLADHGTITTAGGALMEVTDVQKPVRGLIVHRGTLKSGTIAVGEVAEAHIDPVRRRAIARAHTATHMVHKALRETLGDTATQAGSENAPGRLRFDFRYGMQVSSGAMDDIEGIVNDKLTDDLEVTEQTMSLDDARASGAMALFGEKYGNQVRVVSIGGPWSRELCGGTHVRRTGELGLVSLLGEASIGSGVRRVEALVADRAFQHHATERTIVAQLTDMLKVRPDELAGRVDVLMTRLRAAEREMEKARTAQLLSSTGALAESAITVGQVAVVRANVGDVASGDDLRAAVLQVRDRLGDTAPAVIALGGVTGGKPLVVVATNAGARTAGVRAGVLAKTAARRLGGGGGGKDDLAQGGGSDSTALDAALDELAGAIREAQG